MKADLSRLRLAPTTHDEVWLEQQGRVRLDSDHNEAELARLLLERLQSSDVIGGCGVPEPGRGFQVVDVQTFDPNNPDFGILGGTGSRGHFYVDGILCRNELDRTYLQQTDDLPFPPPIPAAVASPANGVGWSAAPELTVRRTRPMVVRLADGSVLAVGGYGTNSGLPVPDIEIFQGAGWTKVGKLAMPRAEGALVLLPGGSVLVTGGYVAGPTPTANVPTNSCEILSPGSLAWTIAPAGAMANARARHTAVLATNGTVFAAGGDGGSGPIAAAEVYDPGSNTWTATPPMQIARMQHVSAALQNGNVIVAGGQIPQQLFTADSVLYDLGSNIWRSAGHLSEPKAEPSCTILGDNTVLVAGGRGLSGVPLSSADVYDQSLNAWRAAAPMSAGRFGHGAALMVDGTVLVHAGNVAGAAGATADNSAATYDPGSNLPGSWSWTSASVNARYPSQAILLGDGTVMAIGGTADVPPEIYHPQARGLSVVYLETWRRLVTQHQDPSILESALNGTDTTARLRNVAQIKVVAVDESQDPAGVTCARAGAYLPGPGSGRLTVVAVTPTQSQNDCALPDPGSYTGRENRLYRIEIHDGGNVSSDIQGQQPVNVLSVLVAPPQAGDTFLKLRSASPLTAIVPLTTDAALSLIGHRWDLVDTLNNKREAVSVIDAQNDTVSLGAPILSSYSNPTTVLVQPDRGYAVTSGSNPGETVLKVATGTAGPPFIGRWHVADPPNDEDVFVVALEAGAVVLASGLQHPHGTAARLVPGTATFKWSRSNASFAAEATVSDPQTLNLSSLGQDAASALKIGDLVEVIGDGYELSYGRGQLYHVQQVKTDPTLSVLLDQPLDGRLAADTHLLVRRWDGQGTVSSTFVSGVATPDLDLGDGVHIQFGGWDLRPGDFWWFTSRAIDGTVETRTNVPPDGVERHACPIALLRWRGDASNSDNPLTLETIDCRTTFDPLTGLQAKHVGFDDSVCAMGAVTVQEALNDICGRFNAADISYQATCPGLAAATTVQEALDLLCEGAQSVWPTVTDINWPNDGVYEMAKVNQGLAVTASQAMIPATVTRDTFLVDLDLHCDFASIVGGFPSITGDGPPGTLADAAVIASLGNPTPTLRVRAFPAIALDAAFAASGAGAASVGSEMVSAGGLTLGGVFGGITVSTPSVSPTGLTAVQQALESMLAFGKGVAHMFRLRLRSQLYGAVSPNSDATRFTFTPQPSLDGVVIEELALRQYVFEQVHELTPGPGVRMLVTLKGSDILAAAGANPPLDGEVMGQLDTSGTRIDLVRDPHTHLIKGGNGIQGGDFESWFFVGVPPRVAAVFPFPGEVVSADKGAVTTVYAGFTKAMDPAAITPASFQVLDASGTPLPLTSVQMINPYLAGLNLSAGLIATLTQPELTYTIVLSGSGSAPIKDYTGLALDGTNGYVSGTDFSSSFLLLYQLHAAMSFPMSSGLPTQPVNTGTLTLHFDRQMNSAITAATMGNHVAVMTPPDAPGMLGPPTPKVTLVDQQTISVQNGYTFLGNFLPSLLWGQGQTTVSLVGITDTDGYPLAGNQPDGSWKSTFTVNPGFTITV